MITFKAIEIKDIFIIIDMMKDFYAIDDYPIDVEISKTLFQEFIKHNNLGSAWLVHHNGDVAGYVILTYVFSFEYQGKIAFIDELYVKEIYRGKGVGKAILQYIQQQAQVNDLKLLYLEVENHNESAEKLYLSNNFVIHNRKLMKYKVVK
ncbi:MAG TPA: GNAT family N-acetyltransferase [Flavobacterium sp.]|uniref:GNAT family N-acetyltransferase n=1 Tax=Flavobacterium sp. TaxID=239 RepID=UPI002B4B68E3|nr:GNAT family N-acetyltransferase [Flavobacterium sp.]HLO72342.1 GNAT family N-acetyltransferase [Flavobacterium sp.]